jgi:predicted DNA-binding transcriptional regulator YafY
MLSAYPLPYALPEDPMQNRLNPDRTRGMNLISLFAKLFFSAREYSLIALAQELDCSKQTVISLIEELQNQHWIIIDSELRRGRRYYRMRRSNLGKTRMALTDEEMEVLLMCRAFTGHLLGRDQFDIAMSAIHKSRQLMEQGGGADTGWGAGQATDGGDEAFSAGLAGDAPFGIYRPGAIDYTPHQKHWHTLLEAMDKGRVCEITYKKVLEKKAKRSRIKPLKIFSHRESIYVHARYAKMPGELFKPAPYDPLLALHRIQSVEMTDTPFKMPADYDFEKVFNQHFGVIKGSKFKVKAELSGWAAGYMAERRLSPDQKITRRRGGKMLFEFSATSEPEVMGWILSFGEEAKLLEPEALVTKLRAQLEAVLGFYR